MFSEGPGKSERSLRHRHYVPHYFSLKVYNKRKSRKAPAGRGNTIASMNDPQPSSSISTTRTESEPHNASCNESSSAPGTSQQANSSVNSSAPIEIWCVSPEDTKPVIAEGPPPVALPPANSSQCVVIHSLEKTKEFLDRCNPSLTYFLPSFIQLGFVDDRCLEGVLRWPKNEITLVLEKWKYAGKLTELEAQALRISLLQLQNQTVKE